jgi:glycosyltransferase involved in cell wall biosynthesis
MLGNDFVSDSTARLFSILIGVHNDWGPLEKCLRSLEQQTDGPRFEVVVVDDGSGEEAPEPILQYRKCYPLKLVRQPHTGIAAARNQGILNSSGSILVFTDADCRFRPNCLSALDAAISEAREHSYFQLHLAGDCSNLVGRAEELRLMALQQQTLQSNGCIRYLNTAGFAVRGERVNFKSGLFDPGILRGEDTLLLATLMQRGELPFFVATAIVQHSVSLSLTECFLKDMRAAWFEAKTYKIIAARGVQVRMDHWQRISTLFSMWKMARRNSIGRMAWFVVVIRQLLQRAGSFVYRLAKPKTPESAPGNVS